MDFRSLYTNGVIAPWYLKDSQLKFYQMLREHKEVVAKCHRRFGKGTTTLTYVAERCLTEKIIVRYGAETQGQAYQIFQFLIDKIFYKCPDLKPKFTNGAYFFPSTESKVYIFGVKDSGEIDKARGTEADIIVCDEYGFWRFKAEYILKSVLMPQLLETNGQIIITSTPPEDLTHNYVSQVVRAEADGRLFNWTMDNTVEIGEKTPEEREDIIKDCGGINSVHYQREYQCELIPTRERLVIPEAQNEELYTGKQERPGFYDFYVCMDLGLIDNTAVLFGYLDFKENRLVVESEYYTNYSSTSQIVEACRKIESDLGMKDVYRRIGDCEMQQLFDMTNDHDYQVSPITKRSRQSGKGFRDSVINQLRVGLQEGRLLVHPEKCPNLIRQLKYGIWNEKRTDFERTDAMGHLDSLMALAYLFDNINWSKNPYPHKYANLKVDQSFVSPEIYETVHNNKHHNLKGLLGK